MCGRPARRRGRLPSISATLPRCCARRGCSSRPNRPGGARSRLTQRFGRLEQSRHRSAGGLEARREPALPRTALALAPNNVQTLNNLGNTLKRIGHAAEAEKRWNAALALQPDYAEVDSNLEPGLIRANTTAPRPWRDGRSSGTRASPTPTSTSPRYKPARHDDAEAFASSRRSSPSRPRTRARSRRERCR